jgi:hypothetical protein
MCVNLFSDQKKTNERKRKMKNVITSAFISLIVVLSFSNKAHSQPLDESMSNQKNKGNLLKGPNLSRGQTQIIGGSVLTGVTALLSYLTYESISNDWNYEFEYDDGPNCTIGKRCGNTCISRGDTCYMTTEGLKTERIPLAPILGINAVVIGGFSILLYVKGVKNIKNDSQNKITLLPSLNGIKGTF